MDSKPNIAALVMKSDVNPGKVSMRNYFSSHHLWAAENNSRKAKEIEDAHTAGSQFDIEHRAYVIGAIISSVSFLEALINELFQDISDKYMSYLENTKPETFEMVSSIWDDIERGSILEKFQLGLFCYRKPLFNRGESPYQEVDLLIKVRNDLIHYKPKDLSSGSEHSLEKKLKGKFSENKMMVDAGNNFYPDKCFGYGCANWAINGAKKMATEFCQRIEVVPNYQRVRWNK